MLLKEFKQGVLEEKLFKELKDNAVVNSEKFRKKYKDVDIDHFRLYRRIINYQIKKYGCSLESDFVHVPSYEEKMKLATRKRERERRMYK